jgi:beta-N-acetylhexosaminidase
MAGAAAFGDIVERARLAWAAGCDVLPICNDRAAVIRVLESGVLEPEPVRALRLARLHGRGFVDAGSMAALLASPEWQRCRATVDELLRPPPALALGGEGA